MANHSDAAPKGGKPEAAGESAEQHGVSADQVANYLRRHPDFFADHPSVLDGLEPPTRAQGNGIVDLQHAMVQRLREEICGLTSARDDLVETGRNNLNAQARIHKAVIALLEARSFEQFIEIITTDLAVILDLDVVTIGVENSGQGLPTGQIRGVYQLRRGLVYELLGPAGEIMLREEVTGNPEIFGSGAGLVRSDALIRLSISPRAPEALLALGSRKAEHFHQGQGMELLTFLRKMLESCFRSWLDLPPS